MRLKFGWCRLLPGLWVLLDFEFLVAFLLIFCPVTVMPWIAALTGVAVLLLCFPGLCGHSTYSLSRSVSCFPPSVHPQSLLAKRCCESIRSKLRSQNKLISRGTVCVECSCSFVVLLFLPLAFNNTQQEGNLSSPGNQRRRGSS